MLPENLSANTSLEWLASILGVPLPSGELNVTLYVPEAAEVLDIPAGPIDLQRLFYWRVFKAFYRPEMTLEEMNHIDFDWFAPKSAHRQSADEVRAWCAALGLAIEHERVEGAGLTVIARKSPSAAETAN